jgi:hypothetical protein
VTYFVTIYGLQWYLGPKPEGEAANKQVGVESKQNPTEKQYSSDTAPTCMEPPRSMQGKSDLLALRFTRCL